MRAFKEGKKGRRYPERRAAATEKPQPRRKKEQLMWKKLGYHGNFVNTKKTC